MAESVVVHSGQWRTSLAVTAFCTITLYNFVELNVIVFNTFKRRSGLYFWSFLIASNGLMPYALGFLMLDLELVKSYIVYMTLIVVGWICTVTGQSVVLYSRLHLVMQSKNLKYVLIMIICNAVICHGPTSVLAYGANCPHPENWTHLYSIYEKVEVSLFFIQELVLSGLYIWYSVDFFRLKSAIRGDDSRGLMTHLIWINIMIILLDVTILALEYAGLYSLQTAYKGMVYSIKLKLEFRILNGLIESTNSGRRGGGGGGQHQSSSGGRTRTRTDNERTAVALDTFTTSRKGVRFFSGGYSTQIHAGDSQEGVDVTDAPRRRSDVNGEDHNNHGITVTTTTEVETQRRSRVSDAQESLSLSDEGGDDIVGLQGATRQHSNGSNPFSSASSEVEFAKM